MVCCLKEKHKQSTRQTKKTQTVLQTGYRQSHESGPEDGEALYRVCIDSDWLAMCMKMCQRVRINQESMLSKTSAKTQGLEAQFSIKSSVLSLPVSFIAAVAVMQVDKVRLGTSALKLFLTLQGALLMLLLTNNYSWGPSIFQIQRPEISGLMPTLAPGQRVYSSSSCYHHAQIAADSSFFCPLVSVCYRSFQALSTRLGTAAASSFGTKELRDSQSLQYEDRHC